MELNGCYEQWCISHTKKRWKRNGKWEMPIPSLTNFSDDKIYVEEIFVDF